MAVGLTRMNVDQEAPNLTSPQAENALPAAEALLLTQLRAGDADAGHRFVREYYPGIYRHLLYLTGRREVAEDLTQETFFQAWRHLDGFEGRAPLRHWLHRIAHREFARSLRSQRAQVSLEELGELSAPRGAAWTEAVELRELIRKLPPAQREAVALHYLEGYPCEEIAQIVGAPIGTVKYRLSAARSYLQRELGEGDLAYLNELSVPMRQWSWLPLDQIDALGTRLVMGGVQAFGVQAFGGGEVGLKTERRMPNTQRRAIEEEPMERREFLRQAAVGAAGLMLPEAEKEVVDPRLAQKVTLAFKGTALSDVCEHLQTDTGVHLVAGNSVADEKVTLFCEKLPLRAVMRQLSRPFGYAWLRSRQGLGVGSWELGKEGSRRTPTPNSQPPTPNYRYELVQDLRSQLLEEELRNRDRNEALIALDREMEQYRPLLTLSPDEALAKAKTAAPEEKKRLEYLGAAGWGPIQMYFRLSAQEQAALRSGQELKFSQEPQPGEQPLPPDVARGVLQARRELRIVTKQGNEGESGEQLRFAREDEAGGLPPSAVPEARAAVSLSLHQTELGRFGFDGGSTVRVAGSANGSGTGPYAVGVNPNAAQPDNARLNSRLAGDPALRRRVTLQPKPSCHLDASPGDTAAPGETPAAEPRVTTPDVLEALHRATGLPIVADFYTRLYKPEGVSVMDQSLFEALNHLSDVMRLRWQKEATSGEAWLQFRSMSFYNDRPKEVPNRLLTRWAAARRQHGALTLDDFAEIAGLPDASLDAREMAEGARACWGLAEWDLACNDALRPHLRWIASFSPAEREKLQRPPGLRFPELSLPQQQQFITLASGSNPNAIGSLAELETATMQVDYSLPGGFEWKAPEKQGGPPEPLSPVRAPSREGALAAARRINPQADLTQIQPTRRALMLFYRWGTPQANGSLQILTTRRGDTSISSGRSVSTP